MARGAEMSISPKRINSALLIRNQHGRQRKISSTGMIPVITTSIHSSVVSTDEHRAEEKACLCFKIISAGRSVKRHLGSSFLVHRLCIQVVKTAPGACLVRFLPLLLEGNKERKKITRGCLETNSLFLL